MPHLDARKHDAPGARHLSGHVTIRQHLEDEPGAGGGSTRVGARMPVDARRWRRCYGGHRCPEPSGMQASSQLLPTAAGCQPGRTFDTSMASAAGVGGALQLVSALAALLVGSATAGAQPAHGGDGRKLRIRVRILRAAGWRRLVARKGELPFRRQLGGGRRRRRHTCKCARTHKRTLAATGH